MANPASIEVESPSNPTCRSCDVTMRLFGIEAHPKISRAELCTYVCPRCEAVEAKIIPNFSERNSAADIPGGAFDAEMTCLLGSTFDAAWEAVRASRRLTDDDGRQAVSVRRLLAEFIIERMQWPETNDRIAEDALGSVASKTLDRTSLPSRKGNPYVAKARWRRR